MKIKKYNSLRTSKAGEVKKSLDQSKVIEIQHYNEPVGKLVSNSEYDRLIKDEKRAKELKS